MMHQYIGARYVPYYYENSLDPTSCEWEPNVNYEPLTVVTLPNLHSYISKKFVPDTIGTPASNPTYWLDRGYDNAYVQALQDQVDILNNIVLKNYIFIGDSYTAGTLPSQWYTTTRSALGLTEGVDTRLSAVDGAGFVNGGFLNLLNAVSVSDNDTITDIIVAGGMNDDQQSEASILSAIDAFCLAAKTAYPNAKVSLAFIGWRTSVTQNQMELNAINAYRKGVQYGAAFLEGTQWALHRYDLFDSNFPNHPNVEGNARIGEAIANAIRTGSYDPTSERRELTCTWNVNEAAQSVGTTHVYTQISGGVGTVYIESYAGRMFAFTINSAATMSNSSPFLLFELPNDTYYKGPGSEFRAISAHLYDSTLGQYIPIKLMIFNKGVYIAPAGGSYNLVTTSTYVLTTDAFVSPLGEC